MANRNTQGFGLIAAGTLGQTPATSGQGKYKIDAGHSTTIYNGECVKILTLVTCSGWSNGSAADILGVLNGIFYNGYNFKANIRELLYKQPITPANSEDTTPLYSIIRNNNTWLVQMTLWLNLDI